MESMSTTNICANCGKGEENSKKLKTCTACKLVKYCSRECQAAHRPQHKKECKKRAAELYDEKLFADPPPREDCPLCFLPLLGREMTERFQTCCGKVICVGCIYAMKMNEDKDLCAFCRNPESKSDEEDNERLNKLLKKGNAEAYYLLGCRYKSGSYDLSQDNQKANELFLKAGELGCAAAYHNLGIAYDLEEEGEVDKKKAKHYYELAAIGGDIHARHNLGCTEYEVGNHHRAFNHFIMAAKAGHKTSLDCVKTGFMDGDVTKDEYANTLRAHQKSLDEMKSDMRDKAAQSMKDGTMWVGEDL